MVVIETVDLGHDYGNLCALSGLNLRVERGESYAFLGLNGAGKSTTVKILTGVIEPSRGAARVLGGPPTDPALTKRMGVVFGENLVPEPRWSPVRYLRHWAAIQGLAPPEADIKIREILERIQLDQFAEKPIATLSGGNKRKVEIARSFLNDPEVLFLDEPTRELDIPSRNAIWSHLLDLRASGVTLFISSHDVHEVETLSDRIGVIQAGRLVWEGRSKDLAENGLPLIASLSMLLQTGEFPHASSASSNRSQSRVR